MSDLKTFKSACGSENEQFISSQGDWETLIDTKADSEYTVVMATSSKSNLKVGQFRYFIGCGLFHSLRNLYIALLEDFYSKALPELIWIM